MLRGLDVLAAIIRDQLPELTYDAARHFGSMVMLMAGAVWMHSTPSEAMKTAYLREPELAALALDFGGTLSAMMDTFLKGLGTEPGTAVGTEVGTEVGHEPSSGVGPS